MTVTSDLYFEIKAAIRKANQSDQTASLIGERPEALIELADMLDRAAIECRDLIGHTHEWNENDYCSLCDAECGGHS